MQNLHISKALNIALRLLCLFYCLTATLARADETPLPRLPFYEAYKKEGPNETRIYLLGTMHLGRSSDTLRKEIVQALDQSSQLVLEISGKEFLKTPFLVPAYLCKNPCLRRQLSAEAFKKVQQEEFAARVGKGIETTPAWLVAMLLIDQDAQKIGLSSLHGTEFQLMRQWKKQVPIAGLETAREQLDVLSSMSEEVQREMVEGYLSQPYKARKEALETTNKLWQEGDSDKLYDWYLQMNESEGLTPAAQQAIDEALINQRNRRFVTRLQPFLEPGKPIFLAVGALHLGGKNGVLKLLREQGFTISPR